MNVDDVIFDGVKVVDTGGYGLRFDGVVIIVNL